MPQPGKVDRTLGEFWVDNPWDIFRHGHNLSCYERNRVFFNVQGQNFIEVSHVSAADSDGDARSVVAGDFRQTGQLDLVVRQAGGGSLLLFENQLPARHYLTVSLRGVQSNRQGIGARLVAEVAGRKLVRELYPHNSFRSQMPDQVHFGLGDRAQVDRLTIYWPSGRVQKLSDLAGDRHILITEAKHGPDAVQTILPGKQLASQ